MFKCLVSILLCITLSTPVYAQTYGGAPGGKTEGTSSGGPRKQLATIIFAGLAGAILGLSTLSFYGRPQDYLSNIAIGFAVGVIIGTSYTTYQAATKPHEFYNSEYDLYDRPSSELGIGLSHDFTLGDTPKGLSYQFSF
ncbi:MAG: hypothetical protein KDD22_00935 [Bdellovibrionales bacterium]|nr:hypothetical protein [Bdellovibrionales bacterium]